MRYGIYPCFYKGPFTLQHFSTVGSGRTTVYFSHFSIVHWWMFTFVWLFQLLHFNIGCTFKLSNQTKSTCILPSTTHKTHADMLCWTGLSGKAAYVCVPKTNRMQVSVLLSGVTREHESGSKEHMFSVLLMPGLWADSVWVGVGISKCSLGWKTL